MRSKPGSVDLRGGRTRTARGRSISMAVYQICLVQRTDSHRSFSVLVRGSTASSGFARSAHTRICTRRPHNRAHWSWGRTHASRRRRPWRRVHVEVLVATKTRREVRYGVAMQSSKSTANAYSVQRSVYNSTLIGCYAAEVVAVVVGGRNTLILARVPVLISSGLDLNNSSWDKAIATVFSRVYV